MLDLVEKTIQSGQKLISLRKDEDAKEAEKKATDVAPELAAVEVEVEEVAEAASEEKTESVETK